MILVFQTIIIIYVSDIWPFQTTYCVFVIMIMSISYIVWQFLVLGCPGGVWERRCGCFTCDIHWQQTSSGTADECEVYIQYCCREFLGLLQLSLSRVLPNPATNGVDVTSWWGEQVPSSNWPFFGRCDASCIEKFSWTLILGFTSR